MATERQVPRAPRDLARWLYLGGFLVGAALVLGFWWYHVANERRVVLDHWRARLSTFADDRARLISDWVQSRKADAEVLAGSPTVRALLAGEGDRGVTAQLERVVAAYGYLGIAVVNPSGAVVARTRDAGAVTHTADAARGALTAPAFVIDIPGEGQGPRRLVFAVPVLAEGAPARGPLGAVVLTMAPERGLYPLLTDETVPTRSGEALLFRLEGNDPAYISPFRAPGAGWAAARRSLQELLSKVPEAVEKRDTFDELTDYRGASVLAATRWIPGPRWGLVLKIDRDEALEEFRQARYLASAAAVFLIVAEGSLLVGLWRQRQRAQLLREQIRQEHAIFNLKSYAEKIVASVPSGLLVLSADLRILSANRSFLESFSLSNVDVVGRRLDDVAKADGLLVRIREVLQTGVPQHDVLFDLQLPSRRATRPVRITITGIRIAEEEDARLLLTIQDLAEEERLHAARRASEQRFRDLVQGLDAIVWEADATSLRFTFVSQRAETLLGYPPEHWLREGDFFAQRIHKDDRDGAVAQCRTAIATGADHEFEYRAVAADGRAVWVRDIIHVLRDSAGRPRQLRGLTVDLTERKRAEIALRESEDQLRQAQKMEAVGQLAGGIAHDFNNLLMVIQGDSDLIRRKIAEDHPLRRNVDGIRDAAQQAAALTRQLLAFSRKQVLAPKVVDLNSVVGGMQAMLQRLLTETIQLVFVPKADLGYVKADPSQLEQVIMNLVVNARDAMPEGGRLTMETDHLDLDAASALGHGEATPGRYVVLAVTDTGTGMDDATRERLFEPFFTTKEPGKGTGLGLSTVYGIVRQSGGHIWVYSEIGHGTTFKICLPVVAEQPEREAAPVEAAAGGARGPETVLLVEDAPRVRAVVREILEMNGYRVLEAHDGQGAIELSRQHGGPIHLMVTDVVMPQMSGRELAQHLGRSRPDMRVLFMSGYTDNAIVRHGVLEAGTAFLSKPFTPDALAAKVREVLDAPRPPRVTAP
ncbi:MAG TPA: ATP-binding protein [Methylomirabilota bacterium]|nr:ATP-binding protein [Methylomirabilota bacterium]